MAKIKYEDVMAMKEVEFYDFATAHHKEWMGEAIHRTEVRKTYPRVPAYNEEKGKIVYVADKTQPAKVKHSEISFFSLKKAYCAECLNIKPVEKKKETFRERYAKKLAGK